MQTRKDAALAASIAIGLKRFLGRQEGRGLVWLPVAFGTGIAIYFALPFEPEPMASAAFLVAAALLAVVGWRLPELFPLFVALLALSIGFATAHWRAHSVASPTLTKRLGPVTVSGRLAEVQGRPDGLRLVIEAPRIGRLAPDSTPARVRIKVRRGERHLLPGDEVELRAVLLPPSPPVSPFAYDFGRQAWFDGIGAVGYAYGDVHIVARPEQRTWAGWIAAARQALGERVRARLPGPAAAVTTALLTGDRGTISEPTMQAMRDSGLAHLLAISGLHVGLIATSIFFLVRLLLALAEPVALRFNIKKWAATAALAGALVYLLLTGATVPTQRAFIMAALALGAILLDRAAVSMRLLAVAALCVLALRPESLLSVSFQMSFAAVLGLVAAYELLGERMTAWRRGSGIAGTVAVYLLAVAATTVIASLATSPIAAYHFNRVASYGLVANLVAVPIMALWIMPMAVLVLASAPFGLEAWALSAMGGGVDAVLRIADLVSHLPNAASALPAVPPATLALFAAGGIFLCLIRGRGRLLGVPVVATAGLIAILHTPPDILVSTDGGRLAVQVDGRIHATGHGGRLTMDTWLADWGIDVEAGGRDRVAPLTCDVVGCVAGVKGWQVSYARDGRALDDDCRFADLVVASVPVGRRCPAPGATVIDRFDLWRDGAHAIWIDGGRLRIYTVSQARGERPWNLIGPRGRKTPVKGQ
jgi:competence protein ComEC